MQQCATVWCNWNWWRLHVSLTDYLYVDQGSAARSQPAPSTDVSTLVSVLCSLWLLCARCPVWTCVCWVLFLHWRLQLFVFLFPASSLLHIGMTHTGNTLCKILSYAEETAWLRIYLKVVIKLGDTCGVCFLPPDVSQFPLIRAGCCSLHTRSTFT